MVNVSLTGFDGKVAIISGGATRIGGAIARALVAAGSFVVIADINAAEAGKLAEELKGSALAYNCDITDDACVAACVDATRERFGRVDMLVNVACSYLDNGIASSGADWLSALNVNLVGAVRMTRAVHAPMKQQGGGSIVNIGSISGKVAQAGRWVYPASKAAILQLTRSAALDLAADRIRVNSVSPGWTWSNVLDAISHGDRTLVDRVAKPFHMIGRAGNPEEIANAVLFLCSDQASFITGTDLAADGGYAALGPEQTATALAALDAECSGRLE